MGAGLEPALPRPEAVPIYGTDLFCESCGARTHDHLIKSQELYLLS